MSAQRKLADPALTASLENVAPVDDSSLPEHGTRRSADGDLPTSPAVLLQEQLAARLAGPEASTTEAEDVAEPKWPIPLRIATIVGLSLALWGGIFLATATVLT